MAMTLRLPEDLHPRVKRQADDECLSVQQLVVKAVLEYVERKDKNSAILASVAGVKLDYADALRRLGE